MDNNISWSDVKVFIGGQEVVGVKSLSYPEFGVESPGFSGSFEMYEGTITLDAELVGGLFKKLPRIVSQMKSVNSGLPVVLGRRGRSSLRRRYKAL